MFAKLIGFQQHQNLGIVQIAAADQDSFQFISSERAIKAGLIEVKEVGASANVNKIIVLNHSDQFVFMMDGDILAGAKQNRVVNTSILLAPQSKTHIPVSCVEQGRWSHISPSFSSTDYTAPAHLRADKAQQVHYSLKMKQGFAADQGHIWNDVADYHEASKFSSKTSNLSDLFEAKRSDFETLVGEFKAHPEANGFSVFLGKDLVGIDLFNRKDIYAEYFPKLLRGAAIDAYSVKSKNATFTEAEGRYRTMEFFDGFDQLEFESYHGVAVGEEKRFDAGVLTGFALWQESHLIHLAALRGREKKRKE